MERILLLKCLKKKNPNEEQPPIFINPEVPEKEDETDREDGNESDKEADDEENPIINEEDLE